MVGSESSPAGTEDGTGVALYYKYFPLSTPQRAEVAHFYREHCESLRLTGRVRVASDGVNVTLGGLYLHLVAHMQAVKEHPIIRGADVDFKVARSPGAKNQACRTETGFDRLRVVECEEVVTMGSAASLRAGLDMTAVSLSPQEFHDMLTTTTTTMPTSSSRDPTEPSSSSAANDAAAAVGGDRPVVLVDARNLYESRIGYFASEGVPLLRPCTRQFSDLPTWLDRAAEEGHLRGKRVLMYCTGGVRCERASAYLRSKGEGYEEVYQLRGGIQRYLEAFPDGGCFRGKNFVFDERVAVGPERVGDHESVVGTCLRCGCAWDDYTGRERCMSCRMLILLCQACSIATSLPQGEEGEGGGGVKCELCQEREDEAMARRGGRRRRSSGKRRTRKAATGGVAGRQAIASSKITGGADGGGHHASRRKPDGGSSSGNDDVDEGGLEGLFGGSEEEEDQET